MRNLILSLLVILTFSQCKNESNNNCSLAPPTKYFIRGYVKSLDIFDCIYDKELQKDTSVLGLSINPSKAKLYYNPKYSKEGNVEFERLAKLYNDISFNDSGSFAYNSICLADTVTNIDISVNKKYNKEHPANSKINDLIKIAYSYPKEYIDNNYKPKRKGYKVSAKYIPLTEFNKKNKILLGVGYIGFTITEKPTETNDFVFTVTITLKSGKTYSYTYDPIRIEKK